MAIILRMPEVLANTTEAVLSQWMIAEGASFSAGDILAEVETEKALVDLPSETDGILGRFIVQPGDSTIVGAPIAVIISVGETDTDIDAAIGGSPTGAAAVVPDAVAEAATHVPDVSVSDAAPRLFASPIARKTAKSNGLNLSELKGTGIGGRIVRRDVEAAIAGGSGGAVAALVATAPVAAAVIPVQPVVAPAATAAASSIPQDGGGYTAIPHTAIPHTGMRKDVRFAGYPTLLHRPLEP